MPRGDGTGPVGVGPLTGRGLGYCAGFGAPGYMNARPGYGFGFRRRGFRGFRGYGYGYGYYGPAPVAPYYPYYNWPDPEAEKSFLVNQTNFLKDQLSALEKRLAGLNDKQEKNQE